LKILNRVFFFGFPAWRVHNLRGMASLLPNHVQVCRGWVDLKKQTSLANGAVWVWGADVPAGLAEHVHNSKARAAGRTVVLVPGQVEDDASIRLGCTTVRTNLALLQAVRAARPNAFIVYKPHPDVASGNRKGRVALQAARQWANHIETTLSVVSCIDAVDEVHTMTSLSGFDALLRGRRVVTYGQPFYAGWGLTEDRAEQATAFERRTRRLSLDELVAGALLHYPIYWDWTFKGYTTCEAVLHRIVEERTALEANGGLAQLRTGWLRRQWRKLGVVLRAVRA